MHQAYESAAVLERLPLDIESLAAFDNNLVVGTKQGHLLMYNVVNPDCDRDIQLLRSNKKFSSKPINQVVAVPHHQILVSLSDSIVSIHDLTVYNFPLLISLPNSKGASVFDLEIKYHTSLTGELVVFVRLAIVVKRCIQLYYWKNRKFQPLRDDVILADVPHSIQWCGGNLVVDQYAGYTRIELPSGKQKVIHKHDKGTECRVLPSGRDSAVILQTSAKTIKVYEETEDDKNVFQPHEMAWSGTPTNIVYQDPFILGIVGKNVEVVSVRDKLLLQTVSVNKPKLLISVPVTSTKGSSSEKRRAYIASTSHVWCLTGYSPSHQINSLLENKHYALALRLLDLWGSQEKDDTVKSNREHIRKLLAFQIFCEHRYQEALEMFLEIDAELLFVIGLFPSLVPEDCQRRLQYPTARPKLSPTQIKEAIACLIDYLLKKRQRLVSQLERFSKKESQSPLSVSHKKKNAMNQQLQVVDTTLLKCYLQERPGLVGPLLRIPDGRVSLAEGERLLKENHRLPDFLLLLRARGQHSKALSLLHQHQNTTDPSPLKGPNAMVEYLHYLSPSELPLILQNMDWLTTNHPLECLEVFTGVGQAVSEAEHFDKKMVLEYLLKKQPRLALLYLEHIINEWGEIREYFHEELIKLYRNFLTGELDLKPEDDVNSTPSVSTSVRSQTSIDIEQNFEIIAKETTSQFSIDSCNYNSHPDLALDISAIKEKLLLFLSSSQMYKPATVLLLFDSELPCLLHYRAVVLCRLGQHKKALEIYIKHLKDLRAALMYCHEYYSSEGSAKQIYIILLELLIQCEDINSLMENKEEGNENNFSSTLKKVEESSEVFPGEKVFADSGRTSRASRTSGADDSDKYEVLLKLLHIYSKYIRLKPAVQLLPDSLSMQELRAFLQCWVRQYSNERRKLLLQKGAAEAVSRQVSYDLCMSQSNKITLSTQTVCCICKKNLTKYSAFVSSPAGAVSHFSCRERLQSSWYKEVAEAKEKRAVQARTRAAFSQANKSNSPGGA